MGKIYVGQSALTFKLETGLDAAFALTAATVKRIYYKKPVSSTIGYWDASITETTKLKYDVVDETIIDESGKWVLWAYCVFPTGIAIGEAVQQDIYDVGR